jgi:trimethylamine---corrinoid protein Co-methyltransferase
VRPKLEVLDAALLAQIIEEALQLLRDPGIAVETPEVVEMLASAGATIHEGRARIPELLAGHALATAPRVFFLYDRSGNPAVCYGDDAVHFDPGSSCLKILDPETLQHREAVSADLVRLVRVTEELPQYAAQSTALVCGDVPKEIGDWYRLLLVLLYSHKPVVTGAFSAETLQTMLRLLVIESRGEENLRQRPRAIFDVCPSPPLNWSDFASLNLVQLARAGVPAEIIPVPMAGATAPITLAGAVVQHAAECIGGIVIHQLAKPGAAVVWGGAPTIFDMKSATAPMGAIETAMLNAACAQVGKHLGLPTHGYLVASDSKLVDAQAGMESAMSAVVGALAGINMISGAGMLDFLACHSLEKLVIDAEAIASAQRLLEGIQPRTQPLATAMFANAGVAGDFLSLPETLDLFRSEQHFPSSVTQRTSDVVPGDGSDAFARAHDRVEELLRRQRQVTIDHAIEQQMLRYANEQAEQAGAGSLPEPEE